MLKLMLHDSEGEIETKPSQPVVVPSVPRRRRSPEVLIFLYFILGLFFTGYQNPPIYSAPGPRDVVPEATLCISAGFSFSKFAAPVFGTPVSLQK